MKRLHARGRKAKPAPRLVQGFEIRGSVQGREGGRVGSVGCVGRGSEVGGSCEEDVGVRGADCVGVGAEPVLAGLWGRGDGCGCECRCGCGRGKW